MKARHSRTHCLQLIGLVLSIVLLPGVLVISGCSLSKGTSSIPQQAENVFQATIKAPVKPGIHLLTEENLYHRDDWIGIWIENKTNHVLRFEDQSLGFQAYQYDKQDGTWQLALESITAADPHVVTVTPGPRSALPLVSIPVEWVKTTGTIRLVITGTTDQGQPFAAYKDIEIVDQ